MANTVWFKDISKEDGAIVGGKGANLGEMYNSQLPIPNGFMVTADAYKKFIEETKIQPKINEILRDTEVDNTDQLKKASDKIQEIILAQEAT